MEAKIHSQSADFLGRNDYNTPSMHPLFKLDNWQENRIIRRVNRFVVEVEVGGRRHRAHINNTGRLEELLISGNTGYTFPTPHTARTDRRLFAVSERGSGALIDTQFQMKAFEKALALDLIPWLSGCRFIRRNARLGDSLIDYFLECHHGHLFLEVKSAALRVGDEASYPDCPTTRGQKHVRELTDLVKKKGKAVIVFMAALPGVKAFRPYAAGDPVLADLLIRADRAGVEIRSINLVFDSKVSAVCLVEPDLPVKLTG